MVKVEKIDDNRYKIDKNFQDGMKVPAIIYANDELIKSMKKDLTLQQAANMAHLDGIYNNSIVMPEGHQGYGFCIGGIAALDAKEGVISPGGVGYDINCGVRLLKTNLTSKDVRPKIKDLVNSFFKNVPSGLGSKGKIKLSYSDIDGVLDNGVKWAVENGYGWNKDNETIEEGGCLKSADSSLVSKKAKKRGLSQLGSLGSGNHFLEIQRVDKIFREDVAKKFGIYNQDQVLVLIHTGSRGFGHQVCSDNLRKMEKATKKYNIQLPDRELACAPAESQEAQDYFKEMCAAANFAWTNRQMITHWVRESFEDVMSKSAEDMDLSIVYDVAHNMAKLETHKIDGKDKKVYVHRKGATRSFGPNREEVPSKYRSVGQPVIIPGDMGTASYVLVGTDEAMNSTFGSSCHGAGRVLSRTKAKKKFWGTKVKEDLMKKGIYVKSASMPVVAEEAPGSYKDINIVVDVVDRANISKKVVKSTPLGVAKG